MGTLYNIVQQHIGNYAVTKLERMSSYLLTPILFL